MTEFYAVIDRDEDSQFFACVPELPGCHTCGETMEELLENLKEAIILYREVVEIDKISPLLTKCYS
jgi:predicted RNase H-like HicB family nuclease